MGIIDKIFLAPESEYGPKTCPKPPPGVHYPPGAVIRDYKVYKLENAPELMEVQRKLSARGLHSPWLRNEVWRYERKNWGSEAWRRARQITLGWKYAIPLLIVTAIYEFGLKKDDHGHGHGDQHGHGH